MGDFEDSVATVTKIIAAGVIAITVIVGGIAFGVGYWVGSH